MLPEKNELNDETLEKISGGDYESFHDGSGIENTGHVPRAQGVFTCPTCGNRYVAYEKRQDGYCSYCEPKTIERQTIVGDIKTSIPTPPSPPAPVKKKIY